MSRGLSVSVGLHVMAFVAVLVGPAPKAFEWDMETVPVELVAAPMEFPEDRKPEPIPEPEPEPEPELTPPVVEKLPEVEPVVEPPPEEPKPKPEPVKPPPKKVRPPRKFQRVAPKREDDEPSLAERLRQRMEQEPTSEPQDPTPVLPDEAAQPAASTAEVMPNDFPYAWYLKQVQTRVRDSWDTPGDRLIAGRANRVVVRFVIHRDGRATEVTVESGSGTPGLDTSARRAVERAQPFPPLPEPYEGDTLELTVRFTVSGEDR